MSKWVAALVLLMGLWLFLGPFLAPVIGLSRPATQSAPTMAGMGGGMGSMGRDGDEADEGDRNRSQHPRLQFYSGADARPDRRVLPLQREATRPRVKRPTTSHRRTYRPHLLAEQEAHDAAERNDCRRRRSRVKGRKPQEVGSAYRRIVRDYENLPPIERVAYAAFVFRDANAIR